MEKTNIRFVKPEDIGEAVDFSSIDVSFISLTLVLPVVFSILRAGGEVTALIKPQFEAGREKVGKKGVVRDPEVHREVIRKIWDFAAGAGFIPKGLDFSPIRGPEGNIEYLLYLGKPAGDPVPAMAPPEDMADEEEKIRSTVAAAHAALDR